MFEIVVSVLCVVAAFASLIEAFVLSLDTPFDSKIPLELFKAAVSTAASIHLITTYFGV